MLVEHLSKSPIWSQTAIFVVEDDAQNGPDHVDAHRSNVLVISPYVKRNPVDHTMYSTSGMLRTMELILGLPPIEMVRFIGTVDLLNFQSANAAEFRMNQKNVESMTDQAVE